MGNAKTVTNSYHVTRAPYVKTLSAKVIAVRHVGTRNVCVKITVGNVTKLTVSVEEHNET